MPSSWVHKARELTLEERLIVERWLGRSLGEEETLSLNVYSPHPAPSEPERQALRQQIISQARQIGSRAPELGEEEADALLEEALREIRRQPS